MQLVRECTAGLDACVKVLLEAFCDALLVGPDVDRLTNDTGARLNVKAAGGKQAIVFSGEVGSVANARGGTQLGAVAAEVLVEQDQVDGGARDAAGGVREEVRPMLAL